MRGCFCSYERVPVGPRLNVATDPRALGPFWIRSLFLLLSALVIPGVPKLGVLTCQTISSMEVLHKFLCAEMRSFLDFRLIGLLLLQSLIQRSLLTEAVSILVLVTHPMLDYHAAAIQPEYPTTNRTLVHRVRLQLG